MPLTLSGLSADGLLDGHAAQLQVPLAHLHLVQLPLQLLRPLQAVGTDTGRGSHLTEHQLSLQLLRPLQAVGTDTGRRTGSHLTEH